jgi:hypothetical protein
MTCSKAIGLNICSSPPPIAPTLKPAAHALGDHMPGRRNLARERANHAIHSPAHQAELYRLLHTELPHSEVVLIGQKPIQAYLNRLGLRRRNGQPLTWRMLERWRRIEGLPILRGVRTQSYAGQPVTTSFALTAWVLSRFDSYDLFRVVYPQQHDASEASPRSMQSRAAA